MFPGSNLAAGNWKEFSPMDQNEMIAFFDRRAPQWDEENLADPAIVESILDNAQVGAGQDVLDVACGTGVLFPWYLKRKVKSLTAIDLSPAMVAIAKEKAAEFSNITLVCGDVETWKPEKQFDRIVVYNAFPHFPYPKRLLKTLAGLLKEGGRLTVAHGASREAINAMHEDKAAVSQDLMEAQKLTRLFDAHYDVEVMISNDRMYQVVGRKRDLLAHEHCGVPHTHGGLTHSHTHGELPHSHTPEAGATPLAELLTLMKYLVSHNDAHAQEVADLAGELLTAGKNVAYDEIMDAVADFDTVNAKLAAILNQLSTDDDL